jgi:hypothetical protein
MSATEAAEALTDVLANLGCDAGTEDPKQVAEAERLLKLDLLHFPPDSGTALLAELEAARELIDGEYPQHAMGCMARRISYKDYQCDCGFDAAIAKYDAARGAR